MDEKKVREAIELIKQEIYVLEKFVNYGSIIEEKKKKHIGLYKTAIKALEKQLPKKVKDKLKIKPVLDENGAYVDADMTVYLFCSNCGEMVGIDDMCDSFCRECGQALDWCV